MISCRKIRHWSASTENVNAVEVESMNCVCTYGIEWWFSNSQTCSEKECSCRQVDEYEEEDESKWSREMSQRWVIYVGKRVNVGTKGFSSIEAENVQLFRSSSSIICWQTGWEISNISVYIDNIHFASALTSKCCYIRSNRLTHLCQNSFPCSGDTYFVLELFSEWMNIPERASFPI